MAIQVTTEQPPAPGAQPLANGNGAAAARSSYGYHVPRRYLWLTDLLVQVAAVFGAEALAPTVRQWLTFDALVGISWIGWTSPSAVSPLGEFHSLREIAWIPLVMIPATLLFMQMLGGYRPLLEQSRTRVALTSILAPLVGLSIVALLLVAFRSQRPSRAFISSLALLTMLGLLGHRVVVRLYKNRGFKAGRYVRNVVVIGPPPSALRLAHYFAQHVPPQLYRLYGFLTPAIPALPAPNPFPLEHLGGPGDLGAILIRRPIHEVIAIQSEGADAWIRNVAEQCDYFRVTLRIVPEVLIEWRPRDLEYMFKDRTVALPAIVLKPRHFDDDALFVKRLFDIVVSAALLVVLSPLFLLIAVAIKLTTPGLPVFYPWRVIGYKGRAFTGYKFTTMQADADERKADLMHLNEMSGPVFKIRNDPRITPLGRFLRKFSLNELPQLWSVLKGDVSLVGPRPAYPNELARYELWHKRKLCVQPGITCLWQIRGRNKIGSFDDWVRMDFEYIDNWSLWLDCRILVRTVWVVMRGTGA